MKFINKIWTMAVLCLISTGLNANNTEESKPAVPKTKIKVNTFCYSSDESLAANIKVINMETNQILKTENNAEVDVYCGRTYRVVATTSDYAQTEHIFEINCEKEDLEEVNLFLKPTKIGVSWELNDIMFQSKSSKLKKSSKEALNELYDYLMKEKDVVIEIGGHTDAVGSESYNLNISQERAETVMHYLVKKGVSPERLHATGYGENNLKNDCDNHSICSESDHSINRRVEIRILTFSE